MVNIDLIVVFTVALFTDVTNCLVQQMLEFSYLQWEVVNYCMKEDV